MKRISIPCPFCGKSVALVGSLFEISDGEDSSPFCHNYYSVVCNYNEGGCGASIGQQYKTAEWWNEAITKFTPCDELINQIYNY